ncbi:MAG: hypothetical protein AAF170_17775 [Bacteroidota bacterium]
MGLRNDVRLELVVPADTGTGTTTLAIERDGTVVHTIDVSASTPGESITWTDNNLDLGTYSYVAIATDGAGNASRSLTVQATVSAEGVSLLAVSSTLAVRPAFASTLMSQPVYRSTLTATKALTSGFTVTATNDSRLTTAPAHASRIAVRSAHTSTLIAAPITR